MRYSTHVKPISYVKAHAAEILADLAETREPMLITQNGEPAAILQDIASYEADQEALALLKMLVMSEQQVARGEVKTLKEAAALVRARKRG
jgi:prevent-host-death family protein